MPVTQDRRWTAAEVRQLTAGNRLLTPLYELVDGELLVTPSPPMPHQLAVLALAADLREYVNARGLGRTMVSPSDIELERESVLQPDVYVLPPDQARRHEFPFYKLLLAVEVLSPSTARFDRGRKRHYYQRNGVPEYWIVDLDARLVERWRPDDERPEVLTETLEWQPEGAAEPLVIDLRALFLEALGEPDSG